MMYGSWDIKCKVKSLMSFCHFLPFDPPNNPQNQNFEEIKKTPGDIILHLCTTNDDHMMYGSGDMGTFKNAVHNADISKSFYFIKY